ncbi:MAG: hypothetical protein ACFCGT_24795 [Sandaracinaceae bacterium]
MSVHRASIRRLGSLAIAFAPLLAGCPGTIADEAPFRRAALGACPEGFDAERDLIAPSCAQLGCHAGGEPLAAAGLDLTPPAGERILAHRSEECDGRALVDPADTAASYFLEKLEDDPACGERMPRGLPPLTPREAACLEEFLGTLGGGTDAGVPALDGGVP